MKYILIRTWEAGNEVNDLIDDIENNIDYNQTDFEYPISKLFLKLRTRDIATESLIEELLLRYNIDFDTPFVYEVWSAEEAVYVSVYKGSLEKSYLLPLLAPEHLWNLK